MSNTKLIHPYWNRDAFVAFLLLHAANADMECTQDERALIRQRIAEDVLTDVEGEYEQLSDYQRIQVIQSYRAQYFADPGQKESLLGMIRDVFQADGDYDIMEHNLYLMLQKIL